MRNVFADTGYWLGLLNPRDELHDTCLGVSRSLGPVEIVTTEMVLVELLNYFAQQGQGLRAAATQLVARLGESPDVRIVPQSVAQFKEAFAEYARRPDQTWSLTDCASFQAMREQEMTEALTHDRHFVQAGFVALLRV